MILTDIDQIKSYLNIEKNDAGYDDLIEQCKSSTEQQIKQYLNQNVETTLGETFAFYGNGDYNKAIPRFPLIKFNKLYESVDYGETFNEIATTEYHVFENEGVKIVRYKGGFHFSCFYKMDYDYGYASIPADVQKIAIELSALMFKESYAGDGRLGLAIKAENIQGVSTTTTYSNYWEKAKTILRPYRAVVI